MASATRRPPSQPVSTPPSMLRVRSGSSPGLFVNAISNAPGARMPVPKPPCTRIHQSSPPSARQLTATRGLTTDTESSPNDGRGLKTELLPSSALADDLLEPCAALHGQTAEVEASLAEHADLRAFDRDFLVLQTGDEGRLRALGRPFGAGRPRHAEPGGIHLPARLPRVRLPDAVGVSGV